MYVLAIETTGPRGSVALGELPRSTEVVDADAVDAGTKKIVRSTGLFCPESAGIRMKVTDEPMGHLRNLMGMAQELVAEAGITPKDIGLVACSVGPGSYTGIRIGVSSARAIAQALGMPAVSVGALDQFRLVAARTGRPVAVIFNARRGQVYGAVYGVDADDAVCATGPAGAAGNTAVRDILPPGPYMLTDVLEKTADLPGVVFYGDGVDAYREQLDAYRGQEEDCELAPPEERYPTAELTLQAAMTLCAAREQSAGIYAELLPRYMRETEAEQKLKDGTLAKLREAKMAKFRSR